MQARRRIYKAIIALGALPGFFLAGQAAHADSAPSSTLGASVAQAADTCTISPSDLKSVNSAAAAGLVSELAARKTLLIKTITCAKNHAQTLQDNLNALSLTGTPATIQSQLSGKLDDVITFYNLELDKIPSAGIAGTQGVAKEVLNWRSSNYEPLAAQIDNFMLWVNNQPLFTAAQSRLNGVTSFVTFLEQAGQNNELQSDLSAAQSLMQSAVDENRAALNAFLQSLPPDQSLALIQQSLQTLSDTYQKFFDISTVAQQLLPAAPSGK